MSRVLKCVNPVAFKRISNQSYTLLFTRVALFSFMLVIENYLVDALSLESHVFRFVSRVSKCVDPVAPEEQSTQSNLDTAVYQCVALFNFMLDKEN